jgi:hypothetical protein
VSYEDHLAGVDVILGVAIQETLSEGDLAEEKAIHAAINLASAEGAGAKEKKEFKSERKTEDHSQKMEEVQENVRQAITELEQKLLSGEMQLNNLKCNEKVRQSAEQEVVSVKSQMPTKPAQEEVV